MGAIPKSLGVEGPSHIAPSGAEIGETAARGFEISAELLERLVARYIDMTRPG